MFDCAPQNTSIPRIAFFSSKTGNTKRLVEKLDHASLQISMRRDVEVPVMTQPYVIILPTYSDARGENSVPKPVIRFLNVAQNRKMLKGVIGAGNKNFGDLYAIGGRVVAQKCKVPLLYRFELAGTAEDARIINAGLSTLLNLTHPQDIHHA